MRAKRIDAWKVTCTYPEERELHGKLRCLGTGWITEGCRYCEWSKFGIVVAAGKKR